MTKIWTLQVDGQAFFFGTLVGAIICRLGFHRWEAVETKTITEIYEGSSCRVDRDFGSKRLHKWQCRRDFCAAEFDAIHEQRLLRYREEREHAEFVQKWAREQREIWSSRHG